MRQKACRTGIENILKIEILVLLLQQLNEYTICMQ